MLVIRLNPYKPNTCESRVYVGFVIVLRVKNQFCHLILSAISILLFYTDIYDGVYVLDWSKNSEE